MAELADLKSQLSDLYASVLNEEVEPRVGAVLTQISNCQLRVTEVELKVKEQTELVERLEALEESLEARRSAYGP